MLAQSLRAGSVAAVGPRPRRQAYSGGGSRERSSGQPVHPSFEAFMAAPVSDDDDDDDDADKRYSARVRKSMPPVRQSVQQQAASSFSKASAVSTEVGSAGSLSDSDVQSPGELPTVNKQQLPLPSTSAATTTGRGHSVSTSAASQRPQTVTQLVVDDVTSGEENYSSFELSPTDVPTRDAIGSRRAQLPDGLQSPELTLTPDMRHSQRRSLVNAEFQADAATKPSASARPDPNATVQRSLDFGQQVAAVPLGPAALLKTLPAVSALLSSIDLGTDSEAEEASKREFFARLEKQQDAPDAAASNRHSIASSLDTVPARDENRAEALYAEAAAATVITTPAIGAASTAIQQAAVNHVSIMRSSAEAAEPAAATSSAHAPLQGPSDVDAESHGLQVHVASNRDRDNAIRTSLPSPSPQLQGQTVTDTQVHAQSGSHAELRYGAASERASSKIAHAHPPSKALPKRAPSRQNTRSDLISPSSRGTAASTPLASPSTLQLSQQFAQLQEQVSAMTAADHKKDNRGGLPRVTDWQAMAEELKAKLAEESAQRKDLARKLLEQKRAVELSEKRIRESYEARVRELQKEKNALALRLQELEHADPRQRILESKDKVVLEAHELAALRQDIRDQELLISGYQTENERMTEKLKEIQAQLKERESMLAQENARLASQLERTHEGVKSQASSFHRVLALEAELASVREEAAMREDELREQLQKAKHEAESTIATAQLQAKNKELSRMVEELTAKLQSHAAVQGRLPASEQRAAELEQQLIASNGGEGRVQYASKLARANRRIHDLEAQVRTLQEQQAGSTEENDMLQTLQQQLAALTTANRLQEEEATRSLLSLQQEHERMKRQYEKRLSQQQSRLDQPAATVRRVQELEKQIEELRTFYSKKLKEATQNTSKESSKQEMTKGGVKGGATKQALTRARDKMKHLEDMLAAKDASIEALQAELQALHERVAESTNSEHAMPHNAARNRASSPSHQPDSRPSSGRHKQLPDEEVARLQRSLEASELSREMLQRSYEEAVERSAVLKHEHEQVLQQLQEVQGEGSGARIEQQQLRKELRAWRQRCEKAESELEDLRMQLKDGPMSAQYQALEKRISEMDARQQAREEQWRGILEETKRVAEMEGSLERHRHALTMEAKNAELARFRAELDAILETAVALQKQILPAHVSSEQESVRAA